jgi:hypothetical protein
MRAHFNSGEKAERNTGIKPVNWWKYVNRRILLWWYHYILMVHTYAQDGCIMGGGVQLGPFSMAATNWPIIPSTVDYDDYDDGELGGMKICRGNRSTLRKPTPSATLSTTNPTWLDPGLNPARRGWKPATNRERMSYSLYVVCLHVSMQVCV